jgi:hypothetical protein
MHWLAPFPPKPVKNLWPWMVSPALGSLGAWLGTNTTPSVVFQELFVTMLSESHLLVWRTDVWILELSMAHKVCLFTPRKYHGYFASFKKSVLVSFQVLMMQAAWPRAVSTQHCQHQ